MIPRELIIPAILAAAAILATVASAIAIYHDWIEDLNVDE